MKQFTLMEEVIHIPTKKKATVTATKVDGTGRHLIEIKYENGTKGWSSPDALSTFIQDDVDYAGEFITE
tara:strand:+ start:7417 stop:7623 length:207 start_codon:yes stop_codon:yes gene_type:complete